MLKLTRKTEYALLALGHLSQADRGGIINVREIADAHQIPFSVLSKVLQRLARAGYVETIKGARGGYRINDDLARYNLGRFLEQMEGRPLGLVDCIAVKECSHLAGCPIRSSLQVINQTIADAFQGMTLADVLLSPQPADSTKITLSESN